MSALTLIAGLATMGALYWGATILIPMAVSFFLIVVLEPLVAAAERRGLPRNIGAFSAVALLLALTGLAGFSGARSFAGIAADVPRYSEKLRSITGWLQSRANRLERRTKTVAPTPAPPSDVQKVEVVKQPHEKWGALLWRGLGSALEAVGLAVFVPFLVLFGLIGKGDLLEVCERFLAPSFDVERARSEVPRMIRSFFLGNLIVGLVVAAIQWAVFAALGLSNAFGIGLVSGFINLLPILGLPLAAALPLAQALIQFDKALPFISIALTVTAAHLMVGNLVMPRVIGAKVKLNAAAATLGMLFWWWVWGAAGFLLAIPLTALVKILLECRPATQPAARLLAAAPRP